MASRSAPAAGRLLEQARLDAQSLTGTGARSPAHRLYYDDDGLALATAAERLLGGATLGVLLVHQFGYDAGDSIARFTEGSLGGS